MSRFIAWTAITTLSVSSALAHGVHAAPVDGHSHAAGVAGMLAFAAVIIGFAVRALRHRHAG